MLTNNLKESSMNPTDEINNLLFKETDFSGEANLNKTITIKVTEETYNRWKELNEKISKMMEYENESKVFEFAIIEALNIPLESIQ